MKRIIILALMMFPFMASSGPPDGGYPKQVPFMLYCHQDQSKMLYSVQSSFHEYIFGEGDFMEGDGVLFFLRDPDDGSFSIVGTIGQETCVVFNGQNFKELDKPPFIPSETDEDI
jgi:hypothetical protein